MNQFKVTTRNVSATFVAFFRQGACYCLLSKLFSKRAIIFTKVCRGLGCISIAFRQDGRQLAESRGFPESGINKVPKATFASSSTKDFAWKTNTHTNTFASECVGTRCHGDVTFSSPPPFPAVIEKRRVWMAETRGNTLSWRATVLPSSRKCSR